MIAMKKIVKKMKCYMVVAVCGVLFTHCTQSDEYMKYMPDGEIIYPQKADLVKTSPGKNRIQLEWVITDPKVTQCKVFYEQSGIQKETSVPVNKENGNISVVIPNLEETTCRFKIVSYDDFGHTSIPVEADELAYGAQYEKTLLNRSLKSFTIDDTRNELALEWYAAIDDTETGIELTYTDINGLAQTMSFARSETSTVLPDFKLGEPLYISTAYKPVPTSIDVFSTDPTKVDLVKTVNVALNKPVTQSDDSGPDFTGSKTVDGNTTSTRWVSVATDDEHWIEIDLLDNYTISALRLHRQYGSPMWRFQAWVDGDWETVLSYDDNIDVPFYEEFEPVTTNKVRWYLPPYTDNRVRLWEIEVWSTIVY
ncbi:hypothetical protein FACS189464_2750 [Bacteroidia bacterium]|nr:hypothetical protein FACS189464_2750 [Bacteroidia bacterium]